MSAALHTANLFKASRPCRDADLRARIGEQMQRYGLRNDGNNTHD